MDKMFRYPNSEEFVGFHKKERKRTKKSIYILEGKKRKSKGEDLPFFVTEKSKKDFSFEETDEKIKWQREVQENRRGIF